MQDSHGSTNVGTSRLCAISRIHSVIEKRSKLQDEEAELRANKSFATMTFFDLSGSTAFRIHRNQEDGLIKAYRHNIKVTEAIRRFGGHVVKWIGDGVLGCFSKDDDKDGGCRHTYRALRAAISAIESLREFNKSNAAGNQNLGIWDEIHTRVGICSGLVHYISLKDDAAAQTSLSDLDPMGTPVDVAARLESLAEQDTILIDEYTFWGHQSPNLPIGCHEPICRTTPTEINWREMKRKLDAPGTVHAPCYSAFFMTGGDLVSSRRASNGNGPAEASVLLIEAGEELNSRKRDGEQLEEYVFGSKPEYCNVRGLPAPILAISIALEPKETPVRHVGYQALKPGEAEKKFSEAETVYAQCASSGNWIAARRKFAEVLEIDPRHDRANIFMAQVARQEGKNADSLRFVECALQANPNLVTAWKMLGLLHFVEYIASGKGNLDRALEAFAEASDRAEKNFDLYTARCCDVFRGMSFFLRDATGDREKAAQLLERVTILTRKSPFLRIMETLLGVMNKIYVDNDAGAAECEQLIESVQKALDDEFMSGDSFLERHDLRLLTEAVRHRVNISKIQATLV